MVGAGGFGAEAAGNTVVAKPAEQTPLIAAAAVRLLHAAGVPGSVLQFLPGGGAQVGARVVADPRVAGVAFTGSTETAHAINRALAGRGGAIPVLIAETGGQNAMIVDSSALPEQVEPVLPAGDDLVHVRLVAGVEQQLVARRVEDPVQRQRHLHDAQVGTQVAAGPRDLGHQEVANLRREQGELLGAQALEIGRSGDGAEQAGRRGERVAHDGRVYPEHARPHPGTIGTFDGRDLRRPG